MEERRKELGRKIQRARRKAGYRSQKAFAAAIGISEASVAYAESGNNRAGPAVYESIEHGLKWADGYTTRYLEFGDQPTVPSETPGGLTDLERAIYDDPDLTPEAKDLMLRTLRRARERSVEEGQRPEKRMG
jgi:transcriptional regulator with XRE-family HTH domain